MRKTILIVSIFLLSLLLASTASAHELWIEVQHKPVANELRVDVSWGHIDDFFDPTTIENLSLFVRYPNGQSEELALEKAGVQGRAFVTPQGNGEYVFWALRNPGTYTPGDGITRLSVQMAKTVFVLGDGPATSTQASGLPFEIIPDTDLKSFTTGTFSGQALLDGEPVADAPVSAYGPNDAIATGETDANGTFSLAIPAAGTWLVKVSFEVEEEGTLDDESYAKVGRTSTLVFNVPQEDGSAVPAPAPSAPVASDSGSNSFMILAFIAGILLGAAVSLFFVQKKGSAAKS